MKRQGDRVDRLRRVTNLLQSLPFKIIDRQRSTSLKADLAEGGSQLSVADDARKGGSGQRGLS